VSVRKRIKGGKARWEVRWREGTHHKSQTFDTRDEALDFDGEKRKTRRMGAFAPIDPSAELLVEYQRRWLTANATDGQNRRGSTAATCSTGGSSRTSAMTG
jgi:hypothetical protein